MEISLTPHRIFILPSWIHRALTRNGLDLADLADYGKVRAALSIDDMAAWFWANNQLKVGGVNITLNDLCCMFQGMTAAQQAEQNNSVLPLSVAEETACNVKTRLTTTNGVSGDEFRFITVNSDVFVIVSEGFLNIMETPDLCLDFIRKYLKQCYSIWPIHIVSQTPIFSLFLKQL